MKFYIDTEFSDFICPDLISLGIVSEDGRHEFYLELLDYDVTRSSQFVKNVVLPLLDHSKHGMTRRDASIQLWCWMEELGGAIGEHEIVTDLELLVDLLGDELPANFSQEHVNLFAALNTSIVMKAVEQSRPDFEIFMKLIKDEFFKGFLGHFEGEKSSLRHHALEDARANRVGWLRAMQKLQEHY